MIHINAGNDSNFIIFLILQLFCNRFVFCRKICTYIDTSTPGLISRSNGCCRGRRIRSKGSAVIRLSRTGDRKIHHIQIIFTGKNFFFLSIYFNFFPWLLSFIGADKIIGKLDLRIAHAISYKQKYIFWSLCLSRLHLHACSCHHTGHHHWRQK